MNSSPRATAVTIAALLLTALLVVAPVEAQAPISVTDTATFNASGPGGVPFPISMVRLGSFSLDAGIQFQNTLLNASAIDPTAVGQEIRTIGAVPVATATQSDGTTIPAFGPNGGQMVAIFGIHGGVIEVTPQGPRGSFDPSDTPGGQPGIYEPLLTGKGIEGDLGGRVKFVELPAGQFFNPDNVESWGFGLDSLAEYEIKPRELVLNGEDPPFNVPKNTEGFNTPIQDVNTSSFDADFQDIASGKFLFEEDPAGQDLFESDSGLKSILTALGFTILNEGFAAVTQQRAVFDRPALTDAEKAILNAIGLFSFGLLWEDGTRPGGLFTPVTSLPPTFPNGFDFVVQNGVAIIPTVQAIIAEPEPAALLTWGAVTLIGLAALHRRGRRPRVA